jgi:hypothetical protein
MFTCEIDTRGLEVNWRDALEELNNGMRIAVANASTEGAEEARATHVYKDQTGNLTKSTTGRLLDHGRGYANGEIVAKAKYASYVENGTAPHDIWPKAGEATKGPMRQGQSRRTKGDIGTDRSALRWQGSDGSTHFARMVHHPGSKEHPFMGQAYNKAARVLVRDVESSIERVRAIMEG